MFSTVRLSTRTISFQTMPARPISASRGSVRAWTSWTEPWEDFEIDLEWVRDAGRDVAVSCHRARMRGKASGIRAEIRYAYLWRFQQGKIVYCKSFGEPTEALEAAGLSE